MPTIGHTIKLAKSSLQPHRCRYCFALLRTSEYLHKEDVVRRRPQTR